MTLPGGASPPAVTADRMRVAEADRRDSGAHGAATGLTRDRIMTPARRSRTRCACCWRIGGSTNGDRPSHRHRGPPGHRASISTALDRMGRETPVLRGPEAVGRALHGGFPQRGRRAALLRELKPLLRLDALTVTGARWARRSSAPARASRRTSCARLRKPDLSAGRHRRAAWQSGAGRRHHQAVRRGPEAHGARGPRGRLREPSRTWRTHRRPTSST